MLPWEPGRAHRRCLERFEHRNSLAEIGGFPTNGIRTVAPALEKYTQDRLLGEVWKRPGLVPRDRSIVTVAALIARNQTIEMPLYLNVALDNGVKPREISEMITHLAFYSGWSNAMSAVAVAKEVFALTDGQPARRKRCTMEQLIESARTEVAPVDTATRARRIRSRLPGPGIQRAARDGGGLLRAVDDAGRGPAESRGDPAAQLGFIRSAALDPIESYRPRIPDEALLKYDDAVKSGLFSKFWVATPTYYQERQIDPWIVGEVTETHLCAIIARWDA